MWRGVVIRERGDAVIKPKTPALITYMCCELITGPVANRLMQKMPEGVVFSYMLAAMLTTRNTTSWSTNAEENVALINTDRCLADIRAKEALPGHG